MADRLLYEDSGLRLRWRELLDPSHTYLFKPTTGTNHVFVYFAQLGATGPIKIGFSWMVESRIRQFDRFMPEPVNLICVIRGNSRLEALLHNEFKEYRMRGEWFSPDNRLCDFVKFCHEEGYALSFDQYKVKTFC